MTNLFFSSDHHFGHGGKSGHDGIILYCNRPFKSVGEMDEVMIQRWNKVVKEGDVVWHLGDFSLSSHPEPVARIMRRLNGEIHLLAYPWHHDGKWMRRMVRGWGDLPAFPDAPNLTLEPPIVVLTGVAPVPITLCHYPFETWERSHYCSISLHGHSHGKAMKVERRVDVGVDSWNFYPVSLEEIIETVK